ncbi:MAG: hypothetical protein J07HN6_01460 [Halonotius sp. J07HN6]|nr:MAG: hypothetical protein J07HN6_01460 [Halonotius sp. J07HN6]
MTADHFEEAVEEVDTESAAFETDADSVVEAEAL